MAAVLFLVLLIIGYSVYHKLLGRIETLEREIRRLRQSGNVDGKDEITETDREKTDVPENQPHDLFPPVPEIPAEVPERGISWVDRFSDFVRENILSISGIVTLILGIGYFVKYAIDKNWIGETARVSIGVLAGIIVAFTGFFLRRNYRVFSYILTGGAVVMLYFSITIGFQEYHLYSSAAAFAILTVITITAVALAYFYNSEALIIIAAVGGFCAPLMASTGESNYPFLFGYISLLNFGMLAVILLKNWRSIGWICFLISSVYFFFWLADVPQIMSVPYICMAYFTFYAFALTDYFRGKNLQKPDILMLVLVNIFAVGALVYVLKETDYGPLVLVPLSLAAVNTLLLIRAFRERKYGVGFSVFSGLVISLITFAAAVHLNNFISTSLWAVESGLLMFLWLRTGQPVFRRFFRYVFALLLISQIFTWMNYENDRQYTVIFNKVFMTSLWTGLSMIFNLLLLNYFLKNKTEETKTVSGFLSLAAFAVFYLIFFFELFYQIRLLENTLITVILLNFSIYYCFSVLLLPAFLRSGKMWKQVLIYLILALSLVISAFAGTTDAILVFRNSPGFYGFFLLFLIPFIYAVRKLAVEEGLFKRDELIRIPVFAVVFVCCTLLYQLYLIYPYGNAQSFSYLQQRFIIFYLPIIWAVLGVSVIYLGIRNSFPQLTKCGFLLIGLMVLKLYLYDIWKMDNVSRIIAFIVLGLILLISSFTFQKLTRILKNIMEKDQEKPEAKQD